MYVSAYIFMRKPVSAATLLRGAYLRTSCEKLSLSIFLYVSSCDNCVTAYILAWERLFLQILYFHVRSWSLLMQYLEVPIFAYIFMWDTCPWIYLGRLSLHTCMYLEKCEEVAPSNIYSLELLSLLLSLCENLASSYMYLLVRSLPLHKSSCEKLGPVYIFLWEAWSCLYFLVRSLVLPIFSCEKLGPAYIFLWEAWSCI